MQLRSTMDWSFACVAFSFHCFCYATDDRARRGRTHSFRNVVIPNHFFSIARYLPSVVSSSSHAMARFAHSETYPKTLFSSVASCLARSSTTSPTTGNFVNRTWIYFGLAYQNLRFNPNLCNTGFRHRSFEIL